MKIPCLPLLLTFFVCIDAHADWFGFRGNYGIGAFDEYTPYEISLEGKSSWSEKLPGRGLSSPIVVGDLVFVSACSGSNQENLHLLAFNSNDGNLEWERIYKATGRTICHSKTCVAASTLASDGKVILAQFSSNDVFCLDLSGNLRWLRGLTFDYPNAANGLGMSSSPVIAQGMAIIQVENDAYSFTAGLNLRNGTTVWKKNRPRAANWTSPIVINQGGREVVVLQSKDGISAIEPNSGEQIWSFDEGASTIPSSAWSGKDILVVPSNGLTALRINQNGIRPETLWKDNKLKPGTPSPSIIDDKTYVINNANVLTCASLENGEILWRLRLKGPLSGSPVMSEKHLFVFSETGLGQIVRLGDSTGEVIRTIELDDTILCTPALTREGVFIRSDKKLWKLGP